MGSGSKTSILSWNFEVCQLCEQPSHSAVSCPFMYSKCLFHGCIGIRMLLVSENNISKGKRYLKCQFPDCEGGIQWLEDALKCKGKSTVQCYVCCAEDHAGNECPWDGIPCNRNGCEWSRGVKTSKTENNPGKKYLVCNTCKCFEWLMDAIAKHEATMMQEQLIRKSPKSGKCKGKLKIENICHEFANKAIVKTSKCYICDAIDHIAKDCPWKSLDCTTEGCNGTTQILTSSKTWSLGKKFLKCNSCGAFAWLKV